MSESKNQEAPSCPIADRRVMDMGIAPRVTNLEYRCDHFEEKMDQIHRDHIALKTSVDKINENLNKLKNIAMGAVGVLILLEFGLVETIKGLI